MRISALTSVFAAIGLAGSAANRTSEKAAKRRLARDFADIEEMPDYLLRDIGLRRPLNSKDRRHLMRF